MTEEAAEAAEAAEPVHTAHEPGVYFGMGEDEYHGDPALGSTDLRRILRSPPDYWWHSPANPVRPPDEPTIAKIFGRAVHACVLEGREKFERHYGPCDYPGNVKAGKEEREGLRAEGKIPLRREDYNRIIVAGAMIRKNPNLDQAFQNGMSEVSVFWEERGVRLKARFDYLKIRATTDLKSIRNPLENEFTEACRRRFAGDRYDMQAEHYRNGRMKMIDLVAQGRVFGDHDPEWLKKVVAIKQAFAFVYVFWQAEDAPITWALSLSPESPILQVARLSISKALDQYLYFFEKFGLDTAWVLDEPVRELDINELPAWWARSEAA